MKKGFGTSISNHEDGRQRVNIDLSHYTKEEVLKEIFGNEKRFFDVVDMICFQYVKDGYIHQNTIDLRFSFKGKTGYGIIGVKVSDIMKNVKTEGLDKRLNKISFDGGNNNVWS